MNQIDNKTVQIFLRGEKAELLPERALHLPYRSTVIVSDIHIGKSSHFRREGIAVPSSMKHADLLRLSALLENYKPATLIILGDLFHIGHFNDSELFFEWRSGYDRTEFILVKGNHDRISQGTAKKLGLEFYDNLRIGDLMLSHFEADANTEEFVIHGHVHPAVRVFGRARQSAVLHCFRLCGNALVLPAFGEFTGRHVLKPRDGDRFFAIVGNGSEAFVKELA